VRDRCGRPRPRRGGARGQAGACPQRGIARLALETGSPILPIATLRRGWGQVGFIGEPIDPAGFDDPTTLTRQLVAVQSRVFLEESEQVHANAIDVWDDAAARLTRPKVGR
jgi:1-acyl-sn-glycerol-3-phosphate acyltransferase